VKPYNFKHKLQPRLSVRTRIITIGVREREFFLHKLLIVDNFGNNLVDIESSTSKRTRERGEEETNHKRGSNTKNAGDLFPEVQFRRVYSP
jgi:hypothetical protein